MQQGDTISAIATPQGEGGIGVIRISGEHALKTAGKVFRAKNGKPLVMAGSHRAVYGHIVDEAGKVIDEALALVMLAPHSYTVEDVVELQCHGGLMTLRKTLELTWKAGARPAERGEFTKRAFLNGRLDLSEAQAVMDIIQARTETSLTMAAGHLTGHFSKEIQSMRHDVLGMIAHIEAAIDFPEDEVDDILTYDIEKNVVEIRNKIANLLKTAHAGRILRDGLLTAIIGKPNVGKSSLLNSLLREERAIVTDVPGTTRDSIEEYADVGGIPLRIIDTAGIRATDDVVERIGVEKARSYVKEASLILALFDASRPLDSEDAEILKLVRGRHPATQQGRPRSRCHTGDAAGARWKGCHRHHDLDAHAGRTRRPHECHHRKGLRRHAGRTGGHLCHGRAPGRDPAPGGRAPRGFHPHDRGLDGPRLHLHRPALCLGKARRAHGRDGRGGYHQ